MDDTIAALITPAGEGGISAVRISGSAAFAIADQVFHCRGAKPSERDAYTFVYGDVVQGSEVVDEGLCLLFHSPRSYTGEDVVELQGHGGSQAARRMLQVVVDAGARLAEPGEFTKRAFLNGRIDLVQAEAVGDLVRAQSDRAQAAAVQQLDGGLSKKLDALYEDLLLIAAQLEATLDFPEDELPHTVMPMIRKHFTAAMQILCDLLDTWQEGHLVRDGALVVLSGKPNVGKSTLLNALLDKRRAIVSNIAGTTRDSIEEDLLLDGIPLRLVDTAGLRETDCEIEQQGIQITRNYMENADLHIHLLNVNETLDDEDEDHIRQLIVDRSIVVENKTDLARNLDWQVPAGLDVVSCSLVRNEGLLELKETMLRLLTGAVDLSARPHAVISERHRKLLEAVRTELDAVAPVLDDEEPEDATLPVAHLREGLHLLGQITGREYHEALLDRVFSEFCIGK